MRFWKVPQLPSSTVTLRCDDGFEALPLPSRDILKFLTFFDRKLPRLDFGMHGSQSQGTKISPVTWPPPKRNKIESSQDPVSSPVGEAFFEKVQGSRTQGFLIVSRCRSSSFYNLIMSSAFSDTLFAFPSSCLSSGQSDPTSMHRGSVQFQGRTGLR